MTKVEQNLYYSKKINKLIIFLDKINLRELERKLPGQSFIDDLSKENYLICLLGIRVKYNI